MARHRTGYSGERYSEHLGLQLTPRQRRNLERGAEARGMILADFVRSYLPLGEGAKRGGCRRCQAEKMDVALEVNRVGVNLNQMAHVAHQAGQVPELGALRPMLEEVKAALRRVVGMD